MGAIWYHPKVFGNAWMEGIGMTEEKMKNANMGLIYGLALLMAFMLSFFLLGYNNGPTQEGQFDTFGHGVFHGLGLAVFIVLPILMTKKLFEQTKWKNLLINWAYWIVSLSLMGGVMDVLNHWDIPC